MMALSKEEIHKRTMILIGETFFKAGFVDKALEMFEKALNKAGIFNCALLYSSLNSQVFNAPLL